jgi:uncharacterized membrane protein SirB2
MLELCEWLEATPLAVLVRESTYGFPILVAFHIMGLTLSIGMLLWFDLRLLGIAMTKTRVSDLYRRLAPYILAGFLIMFVSGLMLFAGFAVAAYGNIYFRVKLAAMVIAAVNALVFHFVTERSIATWDELPRPPVRARIAGATSALVWMVAILSGRLMSYTMF